MGRTDIVVTDKNGKTYEVIYTYNSITKIGSYSVRFTPESGRLFSKTLEGLVDKINRTLDLEKKGNG